jgi:hypothetical protein
MQMALGNYLQARYSHAVANDTPSSEELKMLATISATILRHNRDYGARVLSTCLRTVTEAIHMEPPQFPAIADGGFPLAFLNFLKDGALLNWALHLSAHASEVSVLV